MKNAKELAGEIYDKYGNGDNSSVELIERDREEVRAEERRACADRFMIKLEECIEPLPNKVEGIITGSDIERLYSAILSPEPVEPSEPEVGDIVLWVTRDAPIVQCANGPLIANFKDNPPKIGPFVIMRRAEVEACIAEEGI